MTLEFGEKKLKDDVQYHEYKVNTMGVKGINTRLPPAELLLMLLNPMYREMNFKHLEDLLEDTINKLRENQFQSTEILTKIQFAHGLIDILNKYVEQETPSQKAYAFLKQYLFTVCPPNKKFVIGAIISSENLYTNVVNKVYMEKFLAETKTNCHSGFHTVIDAVKFWRNPNSVTQVDDTIPLIRNAIVRIFNFSKNSSSIERSFAGIKNNTDPKRSRLGTENMFKQHFLRELRRQKEVLHLNCDNQNSNMIEAITLEQRKKILQKQLAKIDEEIEEYDSYEELNYQKFRE